MENRIKEQQLCLFADRTSCQTMRANQLRLWLSSVAYVLMQALREHGLCHTPLAKARCDTIRLKLLKIGASVRVTVRRVWVSLGESHARATRRPGAATHPSSTAAHGPPPTRIPSPPVPIRCRAAASEQQPPTHRDAQAA